MIWESPSGVTRKGRWYHMVGYTRVQPRIDWKPSIATNSEINLAEVHFAE